MTWGEAHPEQWRSAANFSRGARADLIGSMFALIESPCQRSCEAKQQVDQRQLHLAEVTA
jgi:hypothetical protein